MKLRTLLKGILFGMAAPSVLAQPAPRWPEREIELLLSYGAGGNLDVMARVLAQHLQTRLGVPVVVKNRPGAQGALALNELTRAAANGYTLAIVSPSTISVAPRLVQAQYTKDSFEYAGGWALTRAGLVARGDAPFQTVKDLVDHSKSRPVNFASASALNTLIMEEFNSVSGAKLTLVNFKSNAEIASALLGGHVDVSVLNPSDAVQHVATGKMRFIGSTSAERWAEYPNVPSLAESGFDIKSARPLQGVAAPAGTPRAALARVEAALADIAKNSSFASEMQKLGASVSFHTASDYKRELDSSDAMYGQLLKTTGLAR